MLLFFVCVCVCVYVYEFIQKINLCSSHHLLRQSVNVIQINIRIKMDFGLKLMAKVITIMTEIGIYTPVERKDSEH